MALVLITAAVAPGFINVPFPAMRIAEAETRLTALNATVAILAVKAAGLLEKAKGRPLAVAPPAPSAIIGNCKDVKAAGETKDGWYDVKPTADAPVYRLYCDMTRHGGGWTKVMRGIAADGLKDYTTKADNQNIPDDLDLEAYEAANAGKTWKLSDAIINEFKTPGSGGSGDNAATIWQEGAGSACKTKESHFYTNCAVYKHTAGTKSSEGCGRPSSKPNMESPRCAGAGTNAAHMGVGCPSGDCTHSNTNGERGWYFKQGGCANGKTANCHMNFWVR